MEDLKTPNRNDFVPQRPGSPPGASRALNIADDVQILTALCAQHAVAISTIEPLDSGGTRVVLKTVADAETLRRSVKGKLIEGQVVRSSLHVARRLPKFG